MDEVGLEGEREREREREREGGAFHPSRPDDYFAAKITS
jgi:hypothetical protein